MKRKDYLYFGALIGLGLVLLLISLLAPVVAGYFGAVTPAL